MKKTLIIVFCLFLLILSGCGNNTAKNNQITTEGQILDNPGDSGQEPAPSEVSAMIALRDKAKQTVTEAKEVAEEVVAAVETPDSDLPDAFDQDMGFARQAPFGEWEVDFYQDGCEEASLITVDRFFRDLPLDEAIMKEELKKVEPWELERFGYNLSVDTEEVAIMAREFYDLDAEVSDDVTAERIKQELVAGNLIILPLAGREIGNPNYTGEGPLYHMLVVKGYDRDQFITNDPGTRLGKNYKYKYNTLIDATHDWNGGDIYNGERLMLIVKKK